MEDFELQAIAKCKRSTLVLITIILCVVFGAMGWMMAACATTPDTQPTTTCVANTK